MNRRKNIEKTTLSFYTILIITNVRIIQIFLLLVLRYKLSNENITIRFRHQRARLSDFLTFFNIERVL